MVESTSPVTNVQLVGASVGLSIALTTPYATRKVWGRSSP